MSFTKQGLPPTCGYGVSPPGRYSGSYGSSPPGAHVSILGSSPPGSHGASQQMGGSGKFGSEKQAQYAPAKKFWKRLCFDPTLEPSEFTIGYMESVQQKVRQSGVGAWSLRVHDKLCDIPYDAFVKKFPEDAIPFHRIVYFKERQSIVWESDYFKKKASEGESPGVIAAAAMSRQSGGGDGCPGSLSTSIPGSSPALSRHGSCVMGFAPPAGELPGGSSDEEEDGQDDWEDHDDLVAGQMDGDGLPDREEPAEIQLPEECWMAVLLSLGVRDICTIGKVNTWLRQLSNYPALWHEQYVRLFGEEPRPAYNPATVRRMCRRSEIQAARWLQADIQTEHVGFPNTTCLQLDDKKVVSGDGQAVRVWSHEAGRKYRRIATLTGHIGQVTSVAYDDNLVVSGCGQGMVKVWGMDDLKCSRTFRSAHDGRVAGVALMNGMPISAGEDACVRLWDASAGQPIMVLEAPRGQPLLGLEVQQQSGQIITCGDGVHIWDASTVELLHDLGLPEMACGPSGDLRDTAPLLGEEELEDGMFRCVAHSGNVLAAGLRDQVVLWDPRSASSIGVVHAPKGPDNSPGGACVALQLDDWKLMAGFNSGPAAGCLALYDMRAVVAKRSLLAAPCCGAAAPGLQPLQLLHTSGRICSMRFHNLLLMAGLASQDCSLWTFHPPISRQPAAGVARSSSQPRASAGFPDGAGGSLGDAVGLDQGLLGSSPPGGVDDSKRKKGVKKVPAKKQNRFPKMQASKRG